MDIDAERVCDRRPVGVAGLIQSGGFGSFSKNFGLAAAGLLEAEVVTADGTVRIANACMHPDLFWALKGDGGGSFGVVTRLTLKTRELPARFGGVFGALKAHSDAAFRSLIARIVSFYRERLFNRHWGEQIRFQRRNVINIAMVFQGLTGQAAEEVWRPFLEWVARAPGDFTWEAPLQIAALPGRHLWDAAFLKRHAPHLIVADDRPRASERDFIWIGDRGEAGQFLHGYRSTWLAASLLESDRQRALADALFAASRHWSVALHFNKGLAGALADELAAARHRYESRRGRRLRAGDHRGQQSTRSRHPARYGCRTTGRWGNQPGGECIVSRRDAGGFVRLGEQFLRSEWQQSFWGSNYPRLAAVKRRYDPSGLFFVHHGVGSEHWSADGFNRVRSG